MTALNPWLQAKLDAARAYALRNVRPTENLQVPFLPNADRGATPSAPGVAESAVAPVGHIITAPHEPSEYPQADTAHHVAQVEGTSTSGGIGVGCMPLPPVSTEATLGKIRTSFVYPPIPIRSCDWVAYRDNDEPYDDGHMRQGFGATEAEAIADLLQLEKDDGL